MTFSLQPPPLVGLPHSSLLCPAHTDVLPAAPGEVQRQLSHLRAGEQKRSPDEADVIVRGFVSATVLKVRRVIRQLVLRLHLHERNAALKS